MLNEIDLSRTDLNLLVLFEAVIAEGHVGRAAASLNLSPSAVSHGLGRLRALLGDPLFLRTPRGVVPTDRALELAPRIADVLAGVRAIVSDAEPFDPATSRRRFRIATGDALAGVFGPRILDRLASEAPAVGLSVIHVTPNFTGPPGADAWAHVLAMLDSREADLAVLSTLGLTEEEARFPARFDALRLGEDSLVAVARADHPIIREPTLDAYCAARHMVVSLRGDPSGAVDASLAAIGQARRVVLTVPNFMSALFIAAGSDLVGALPRSLVSAFGRHLGLGFVPLPFPSTASVMRLVVTKAALADAGIAWLAGLIRDLNAPHP